eukprot:16446974-Heterocapsa_arctica.AAC.1
MAKLQIVEKTISEMGGQGESVSSACKNQGGQEKHKWRSGADESGKGTESAATKEQQDENKE